MTDAKFAILKSYMQVYHNDDDELIRWLADGAAEYLANAGVPEQDSAAYELALAGLTLYCYDNRELAGDIVVSELPAGLRRQINQLKQIGEATRNV